MAPPNRLTNEKLSGDSERPTIEPDNFLTHNPILSDLGPSNSQLLGLTTDNNRVDRTGFVVSRCSRPGQVHSAATKRIFAKKQGIDSKKLISENYSHKIATTKKCVTNNDHKIANHRSQNYKIDHKITRETGGVDHKIIKMTIKSQNEDHKIL